MEAGADDAVDRAIEAAAACFLGLGDADLQEEVRALAGSRPGAISVAVSDPDGYARPTVLAAPAPAAPLAARRLERPLPRTRQVTSFSALSAAAAPAGPYAAPPDVERPDHDQHDAAEPASVEPMAGGDEVPAAEAGDGRTAFTFPRGATAGSCLHRIFERLDDPDRAAPGESDLDAICRNALEHFGIDGAWAPAARAMVDRTREVRLCEPEWRRGAGGGRASARTGFRLRDPVRRIVELEFHFPLDGFDRDRFGARLAEYGYPNPFARPEHGGEEGGPPPEPEAPLSGFLRGFMDLVVEHEGRWYVLDYKSNWLGAAHGDYRPAALEEEMRERGYALQYLIYLTALHRYLSVRLPEYDYERHLGGAFYLFIRGIDPAAGTGRGVYFDRPPAACVHALDDCFRGKGAR